MTSYLFPGMFVGLVCAGLSLLAGASFLMSTVVYCVSSSVAIVVIAWIAMHLSVRKAANSTPESKRYGRA
jgi:ABC-type iron transport system FetAB permease component